MLAAAASTGFYSPSLLHNFSCSWPSPPLPTAVRDVFDMFSSQKWISRVAIYYYFDIFDTGCNSNTHRRRWLYLELIAAAARISADIVNRVPKTGLLLHDYYLCYIYCLLWSSSSSSSSGLELASSSYLSSRSHWRKTGFRVLRARLLFTTAVWFFFLNLFI